MREFHFKNCFVRYWRENDFLRTLFADGKECPALFSYGEESRDRAINLGYLPPTGSTPESEIKAMHRMQLEHELAHTFLAEKQGHSVCPVLRSVADQAPNPTAWEQEELVMEFQAFMQGHNTGGKLQEQVGRETLQEWAEEFWERFNL